MEALYTWKDVERKVKIYFRNKNVPYIIDIDIYPTEIDIIITHENKIIEINGLLQEIFGKNFSKNEKCIYLDKFNSCLNVNIEVDNDIQKSKAVMPLFKDVIYRDKAYEEEFIDDSSLEECPVIAFHSYKGGVGRTLSLLAFVKAWSYNNPNEKLMIVDSDIEAPGITWLLQNENVDNEMFCYFDLLEIIQSGQIENEKIFEDVIALIQGTTISVDTGKVIAQHIFLPTYRYEEQLLDVYSTPESIARGYSSRYALAEYLSIIGKKLGVSLVLIDLRAGVSEFSAPLIFDPRVKKYIVTSTSLQSVQGTRMLLKQICKGLPVSEEGIVPELLLTMVPEGLDTTVIKSELIQEYNVPDQNSSYTDNVITELPFASELVHLSSLQNIMKNLEGRDFYKHLNEFVMSRYVEQNEKEKEINNREIIVSKIHQLAEKQITAEGNDEFAVLLTQPISNLLRRYSDNIPQGVMLGAKGAGKTFLFKEMLRKGTWQGFVEHFETIKTTTVTTYILPLITPRNIDSFVEKIKATVTFFFNNVEVAGDNTIFWHDNYYTISDFANSFHVRQEWKELWLTCISTAFHEQHKLIQIDEDLQRKNQRVLFLVDGLEEIFEHTLENENEKNAVQALVQDVLSEFKIKYKNIGLLVFLRKDLASNSIMTNYEQFENQYRSIALNWSHEEALRLALWLVTQAVPEFCADVELENASQDVVEEKLNKLWGLKLGKNSSNEAYSSRWILAALSDFNSQLQARDIIRFLKHATETVGKTIYKDRYIMPTEIKNAVQECSKAKIDEIKQEIAALKPILEELENASPEKKVLPFKSETFSWGVNQEKILKQEGLLIIDNDKYYLPEIIRHALKFKYEKGARPKVLSLLLKK